MGKAIKEKQLIFYSHYKFKHPVATNTLKVESMISYYTIKFFYILVCGRVKGYRQVYKYSL